MSFHFDHWEIDDVIEKALEQQNLFNFPSRLNSTIEENLQNDELNNSFCTNKDEEANIAIKCTSINERRVRYSETCSVVLIPSRQEYEDAGIDLWYHSGDIINTKRQLGAELRCLLDYNPSLTIQMALSFLQQPRLEGLYSPTTKSVPGTSLTNDVQVLIVDRQQNSAQDIARQFSRSLEHYKQLNFQFNCMPSIDFVVKQLVQSQPNDGIPTNKSSSTVTIIEEGSISDNGLNIATLVRYLRQFQARVSVVIVLLKDTEVNLDLRKDVYKRAGVDLIWRRPISLYIQMLPLILQGSVEGCDKTRVLQSPGLAKDLGVKSNLSETCNFLEENLVGREGNQFLPIENREMNIQSSLLRSYSTNSAKDSSSIVSIQGSPGASSKKFLAHQSSVDRDTISFLHRPVPI